MSACKAESKIAHSKQELERGIKKVEKKRECKITARPLPKGKALSEQQGTKPQERRKQIPHNPIRIGRAA